MRVSIQCFFFGTRIVLVKWISLQTKTTLFVGQNLNAKIIIILERREY